MVSLYPVRKSDVPEGDRERRTATGYFNSFTYVEPGRVVSVLQFVHRMSVTADVARI